MEKTISVLNAGEARRNRGVVLTALAFLAFKGFSMLFPLVTIPIFIRAMGIEMYGAYATLLGFFSLFAFSDLGMGNGLLTEMSRAFGSGDKDECSRLMASAFIMLTRIATVVLLLMLLVTPWLSWSRLLGASPALGTGQLAVMVSLVLSPIIIQLPFTVVQRAQLALQEGYKSSIWQGCGALAGMGAVLLLHNTGAGIWPLLAAASFLPCLVVIANWIVLTRLDHPWLRFTRSRFEVKTAQRLRRVGWSFFILSIFTTIGLGIDNFIVAKVCGLIEVPAFSVASRFATLISATVAMAATPLWAANGDALARGDHSWVRRASIRLAKYSLAFSFICAILFIFFGPHFIQKVFRIPVTLPKPLLIACAFREVLLAMAAPFFTVLNAAGIIRPQVRVFSIFLMFSIILKILLGRFFGSAGVAAGTVIPYAAIVLPWVIHKMLAVCSVEIS